MKALKKVLLVTCKTNKLTFFEDGVISEFKFDARVAELQDEGWKVKSSSNAWWRRGGQKVMLTKIVANKPEEWNH